MLVFAFLFSAIPVIKGNKRATKIVEGLLFAVLVAGIKDPARPQCADGRRLYVAAEIRRGATPPVFA